MIETYMSSAGDDVVLMPTGPLTNIAMAMVLEPKIVQRISEVILMRGGHEIGNVTPAAEFNILADPEAARVVLSSGHPRLTMVPLDATHRVLITCRVMPKTLTRIAIGLILF
ncbi:nucleoside hydrolase [Candidatus Dormiibacter inghamiae]